MCSHIYIPKNIVECTQWVQPSVNPPMRKKRKDRGKEKKQKGEKEMKKVEREMTNLTIVEKKRIFRKSPDGTQSQWL